MENKKLLKFLHVNLSELEELVADKANNTFDDFEMEFLQSRLKESKKLVQRLVASQNEKPSSGQGMVKPEKKVEAETQKKEVKIEKAATIPEKEEKIEEASIKSDAEVSTEEISEIPVKEEQKFQPEKKKEEETVNDEKQSVPVKSSKEGDDMELEDEESDNKDKRLGDSFLKGKSVNELLAGVGSNLEHKLSNRPVASIQTAIGINDRFQYTRELFDGSADVFTETVKKLDQMNNIHEAVKYLQYNFKWKKNETSLKFVNLVKRRFLNE